ncbi:4-Hydroxybenzoate Polyprenyltransferase [Manis pentadactyla]|nr:4-Hydroxybenzoate Polyprenyltransferase [Manis pentadactyla]
MTSLKPSPVQRGLSVIHTALKPGWRGEVIVKTKMSPIARDPVAGKRLERPAGRRAVRAYGGVQALPRPLVPLIATTEAFLSYVFTAARRTPKASVESLTTPEETPHRKSLAHSPQL